MPPLSRSPTWTRSKPARWLACRQDESRAALLAGVVRLIRKRKREQLGGSSVLLKRFDRV